MLISFMVTCGNKSAFLEWDYFIGQTKKKRSVLRLDSYGAVF